jgi:excisionase family DNA binding protein
MVLGNGEGKSVKTFDKCKRAKDGRVQMAAKKERDNTRETYVTSALLAVPEAAKYLGVGRKKIYELIEWGEVKAVKLGRSVQVEKNSLDEFKASGKLT